ncbi:MAG TPA: transcriptional repressor [Armatimonadota bacterium]|jgi:Fur family peroxide stress response transcriptional regulator
MGAALEGHGLTPRRRAVLEAVRESHGHLSASEIWERARLMEPRISFATVYNAVHYLCDAGLLIAIPFGDGASLYDARVDRHDHAICSRCGRLTDFDCETAREVAARGAACTGYAVSEVRITLTGLCPACTAA